MTQTPRVLLTAGLGRLRTVLSLPPDSCRPVLYVPEAHVSLDAGDEVVALIEEAAGRYENELARPGAIVVATTAGTWQLR